MNPYSFCLLCFGFCSLFVGLLIWLKRNDSIGRVYLIFSVLNGLWGIFFGIFLNQQEYNAAIFYVRLADTFALFIPAAWFHFAIVYTEKFSEHRRLLAFFYVLAILVSLFGFSDWFIPKLRTGVGLAYFTHPGLIFHFLLLMFITIIPAGFFLLFKRMFQSSVAEKSQLKGFMIATSLGFIGGGLTMPLSYGIIVPQYAMFLMPVYPFLTAYFLIKKGLFNVEEFVQAAHRDKLTAIGVLAASINHEIKNPLFIIKGLAESCLERQKEGIFPNKEKVIESSNDAMKRSIEQADRAMDIIKRLSLFAKAGIEGEIKFEAVPVAEVLEDILPLVRYELAANNITLTREIPKNLPDVQADRRYLEEIFFNLIVNAIQALKDAGKPGEIKINARVEGEFVAFTITDNGPGIPADKLKDVFRPFYTTKAEGTGLGLYITRQLVEKIKGRISVESQPGIGTTFTVRLACFLK